MKGYGISIMSCILPLQIKKGEVSAIDIAKAVNNITVESLDDVTIQDQESATRDLVQTVRVLDDLVKLQSQQLEDKPIQERKDVVKKFSEVRSFWKNCSFRACTYFQNYSSK